MDMEECEELGELIGKELELMVDIKGVRGLPQKVVKHFKFAFIKFNSFDVGESTVCTRRAEIKKSINPKVEYNRVFKTTITEDFIKYVSNTALALEVWVGDSEEGGGGNGIQSPKSTVERDVGIGELETLRVENVKLKSALQNIKQQIEDLATPRSKQKILKALLADGVINSNGAAF